MSFLATALPTMLLFVLASLAVGAPWGRVGLGAAAAAVTAAGYFAVTAFAYRRLWPPRMRATFGPARRPGAGA